MKNTRRVGQPDSGSRTEFPARLRDQCGLHPSDAIVFDERIRESSDRALPRNTKSGREIDEKIGGVRGVWTRVKFFSAKYASNRHFVSFRVCNSCKAGLNCIAHALGIRALFQNALSFAAFEVQVNAAKADSIGVSFRPVHRSKAFAGIFARLAPILECKQSALPKPGIGVEGTTKCIEAVIGKHDQQRVLVNFIERGIEKLVTASVMLFD